MKLTYLAQAYSDPNPDIQEQRYDNALHFVSIATEEGHAILSPIIQNHTVAKNYYLPTDFGYWKTIDELYIDRCDEVWVLDDSDCAWKRSKGVNSEIIYAMNQKKPVYVSSIKDGQIELRPILEEYPWT